MPKSKYLDELISNKLFPNNYRVRYLSDLWNNNSVNTYSTYRTSALNGFTNEINTVVTGSTFLNSLNVNQTVTDMTSTFLSSMITFDTSKLPVNKLDTTFSAEELDKSTKRLLPPGYINATITPIKGGSIGTSIDILFPSSFSRSRNANYAKENPVGSTTPIMAYSYTDAEEIPMEFDALVDYLPRGYNTLNDYVNAVLDILLPKVSNGIIAEPTVQINFADIKFRGVCTSVSVAYDNLYGGPKNADGKTGFVHARLSCSFTRLDS